MMPDAQGPRMNGYLTREEWTDMGETPTIVQKHEVGQHDPTKTVEQTATF